MIKQGLDVRIGQSLSMTPQLQQAIRLLQLSTLELQQEIQENLETNPLLESVEDSESYENTTQEPLKEEISTSSIDESIPEELPMDANWDDIYDKSPWESSNTSFDDDTNFIETLNANQTGLKDHLLWQIDASHLSPQDKIIAEALIDGIDKRGYFIESLPELLEALNTHKSDDDNPIEIDEVETVLHYIQSLDPLGVGARDLKQCLLIQLNKKHFDHALIDKARELLEKKLDLLAKRDYISIKKGLKLTKNQYDDLIHLIRSLQPYPGDAFEKTESEYVIPDVYVLKLDNGLWVASLNASATPDLQVNQYYKNMISKTVNKQDTNYLKEQLHQAKWFLKALQTRNSTILNVANSIIKYQSAFLKFGPQAMKPMILKDIAQDIDVHDSTISRISNQKYIHTPHGIFELKYFFSSHVSTNAGGDCSSTAIRAMIQQFIKEENHQKPLSDNKLTELLKKQGIKVARRTVTKYRETLAIPSSRERKCLV